MEITDDAVPTITRPMTHSSATSTSRSVETATCRPAICTFPLGAGAGVRAGAVERLGGAAAVRAGVISSGLPRPARRGRAHLPRPTPVASTNSPPPRGRSGGSGHRRRVDENGAPRPHASRELRHREEVAVEDAEAQRAEESAEDPEADDHRGLRPPGQFEVVVDRRHPEDPAVEHTEADHL